MKKDDILKQRKVIAHDRWKKRTRDFAFFSLLAEVFFLALSPPAATVFMLISAFATLVRFRVDETFSFRHLPFDVPAVLFIFLAGISVFVSPDRGFSFYNYYNLVGAYAVTYFIVGQNVRSTADLRSVLVAGALSAMIVVIYGYYQFAFGIDVTAMRWVDGNAFPELRKRIFSTWENPNILAGYLDICICLAFGLFVHGGTKAKRVLLGVALLAFVLCLCMTYARGALLVMTGILAGYGILHDWRVLVICLLIGGVLLAVDPLLYERLASVFTKVDTSTEMRFAFWESTLQMIQDHPFLGIGWGAYYMVYPAYDFYMGGADIRIVHAHNIYLNYMAEIGIPGAAAFFWFFFGTMIMALRFIFRAPNPTMSEMTPFSYTETAADVELQRVELTVKQKEERGLSWSKDIQSWEDYRLLGGVSLGLGLAFVSIALNGVTDDLLFNIPSSMFLWLMAALVASLFYIYHEIYADREKTVQPSDDTPMQTETKQNKSAKEEQEEKQEANEIQTMDESTAVELKANEKGKGILAGGEVKDKKEVKSKTETKEKEKQISEEMNQRERTEQHLKGDH